MASLVNVASAYLNAQHDARSLGTAHASIVPYQAFPTRDSHVVVAAMNDVQVGGTDVLPLVLLGSYRILHSVLGIVCNTVGASVGCCLLVESQLCSVVYVCRTGCKGRTGVQIDMSCHVRLTHVGDEITPSTHTGQCESPNQSLP